MSGLTFELKTARVQADDNLMAVQARNRVLPALGLAYS